MKKIASILILLTIIIGIFSSCAKDETTIRVGVMSGPTGMGMAKLMKDSLDLGDSAQYKFEVFSSPNTATAELASGELDMLCLPTNTAAALASQKENYISVAAINCLGSLYLMTDSETEIKSISDLSGKTIYASVPNSTTGPIIEFILEKNNVDATIEFVADHDALVAMIAKNEAQIAVLPEPKATAAKIQNSAYSIDLNLSTEWSKVSELPLTMGCIVVRCDFLAEHSSAVDDFLKKYEESINYINEPDNLDNSAQMIVDTGVLPKLPIAKSALKNLYGSIVYIDGEDMKEALEGFYTAINLSKPGSEFYYE